MYKFVVSSILLIVAVVGLGAWSYYLESNLSTSRGEVKSLRQDIVDKNKELTNTENRYLKLSNEKDEKINSLERTIKGLDEVESELVEKKKELSTQKQVIEAEKTKVTNLITKGNTLSEKNIQLQKQLEQQAEDYKGIVLQLTNQKEKTEKAEMELNEIQATSLALKETLKRTETKCEGLEAKIENLNKLAPEEKINGKVQKTAVSDEVAAGHIIISELTKKPGIGLKFSVFKNEEFIGRVKITRAFESSAGAAITYLAKGKQIQIGDKVSTGFPVSPTEVPDKSDK